MTLWATVAAAASDSSESTTVYIQSTTPSSPAIPLAEITYNPTTLSSEITSYEYPEISPETTLLRVGIYDESSSSWKSSTSVTSVDSFAKGYQPTIVISLDANGGVIGVSCKSAKIDAGATRDFGPKVKVVKSVKAKQPELNKPIVLNPEGKLEEAVPEKTMLQK